MATVNTSVGFISFPLIFKFFILFPEVTTPETGSTVQAGSVKSTSYVAPYKISKL